MNITKRSLKSGKIRIHRLTHQGMAIFFVVLLLVGVTIWGLFTMDTAGMDIGKATIQAFEYFGLMFALPRPVFSHFGVADGDIAGMVMESLRILGITLALSFLTTLFGGIIALFLGLFAAKNLTDEKTSIIIKSFVAIIRAVPTVLWVLIFAIGAGLGSVAAVIGMGFHTVGYLLKAFSESFEEIDKGVIDALRTSGASWFQIVFQAVIPSSVTSLLSWTFMRFEINFGVAVAMGAAAGAGGIGYQLFMAAGYFFDIREIGYINYLILFVALVMEYFGTKLKDFYHLKG